MKSTTYLLVGALVAIAIVAIIKKHFFEGADYDLPTQGNALRFGIEGYEDAEASELKADDEADEAEEQVEGYEDSDDEEVEHMSSRPTAAGKAKRVKNKDQAKLRAAAKKLKAKKPKATAPAVAAPTAVTAAAPTVVAEKFENTSRFQELKAKWDAYKAKTGPALSEAERNELLALLDMPDEPAAQSGPAKQEAFEQFEEMPYQGTEYAMF